MRTRSARASGVRLVTAALAVAAGAFAAVAGSGVGGGLVPDKRSSEAWQGLVGEQAEAAVGQRSVVVLRLHSLATRVAAAGGRASEREERAWTKAALTAQRLFISRMNVQSARIRPEHSYVRVLNGFSATLDPASIALLERAPEVEGVYPVRAAFAASVADRVLEGTPFAPGGGRRAELTLPGFDGRGVTVALLDTGVDRRHSYVRGRVQEGVDLLDERETADAVANPANGAELERHGTQLAGILVGAAGPARLRGVVPRATVVPIRIGGWQREGAGDWAIYSRTDLILAGLERAVDPNGDGDAHDAARVALLGMVERFAAFPTGPLARAAAGALQLDTLVVVPAGNEGALGPAFGSVSGPGGTPAALTVGAADLRLVHGRVRVVLRGGLGVLFDRVLPLAGAVGPEQSMTLALGTPRRARESVRGAAGAPPLDAFFDANGFSRVAGRAALVRADESLRADVAAAATAGASAVLVYGADIPAGAFGLDERVPVPVVAVPASAVRALLQARNDGAAVGVSLAPAASVATPRGLGVAAFSSHGLAFDGRVKPELIATGVDIATSEPGANGDGSMRFGTIHGSSAAAATVAGAAALLAQARPELDAAALKSVLVGSARRLAGAAVTGQGAGVLDVGGAARAELGAEPATLAFPPANRPRWRSATSVVVTNLSSRRLRVHVRVERGGFPAAETLVTAQPDLLVLRAGAAARVRVVASVRRPTAGGPPAEGAVVLRPTTGAPVRVPFAVAFARRPVRLLADASLAPRAFEPSSAAPAVLSLRAGVLGRRGGNEEVLPLARLDIELWTEDGLRLGTLARLRNLLPGRYVFGITGRDPGGGQLTAGRYVLRLRATPHGPSTPVTTSLQFTIK